MFKDYVLGLCPKHFFFESVALIIPLRWTLHYIRAKALFLSFRFWTNLQDKNSPIARPATHDQPNFLVERAVPSLAELRTLGRTILGWSSGRWRALWMPSVLLLGANPDFQPLGRFHIHLVLQFFARAQRLNHQKTRVFWPLLRPKSIELDAQ